MTVCRLYDYYRTAYYWIQDEDERRSRLDKEYLEPYQLLGQIIERVADDLGEQDVIQMLNVYTELDQSYDGFYGC